MQGWILCLGIFGAAFLLTPNASATDGFPAELKKHWAITKPLDVQGMGCRVCHDSDLGGIPPTQPFGRTVLMYGAAPYDNGSLDRALDQVKARAIDSDHDGVTDYDELVRDGTNPSDPKSFKLPPPPPPQPDAGGGGQGGDSGADGGQGGQTEVVVTPPYSAPPPNDFPPPFEHGCALAPTPTHDGFAASLALALAALGRRRARRRSA
jgi:hypothetical protein